MPYYLGRIDRASDGTFGIVFPDLPGCTSAADSLETLYGASIEAIRLWAEDALADGEALPTPRTLDQAMLGEERRPPDGQPSSWWPVPLLLDAGRSQRVNISLDVGMLEAIDAEAKRRGLTRSAFLISAARDKIAGYR